MGPHEYSQTLDAQSPDGQAPDGTAGTKQKRLRRQAERAKKSASVMWINGQIIANSQKGVNELLLTVSTHLPQMNLVNLTTAMHRLGKFASHDPRCGLC